MLKKIKKNSISPFGDASGNKRIGSSVLISRGIRCLLYAGFVIYGFSSWSYEEILLLYFSLQKKCVVRTLKSFREKNRETQCSEISARIRNLRSNPETYQYVTKVREKKKKKKSLVPFFTCT